jgi:hypothetical protein
MADGAVRYWWFFAEVFLLLVSVLVEVVETQHLLFWWCRVGHQSGMSMLPWITDMLGATTEERFYSSLVSFVSKSY